MKRILITIGAAALLAATTTLADVPNLMDTNSLSTKTVTDRMLAAAGGIDNIGVETYFTYAPDAPTKAGGGLLAVYNVTDMVGLGLGLDWLGNFSLVSVDVTLQAPFHPLPSKLPNLVVSPFVLGGIATAYSGSGKFNGDVATIEDVGAYIKFGHFLGGEFNVGACYGQWTGVGVYDVKRYHLFVGETWGF